MFQILPADPVTPKIVKSRLKNKKRLTQLWIKIQEIFPEGVANQGLLSKRVRIVDLQVSREICPVFLTKGRLN